MKKGRRQAGFTLIELMFTIAVAAVLLAIGVPNFRDFIRNSRMSAEANDLLSAINLARSEAVKRRAPVTLCAGSGGACDPDGDFADGWLVFVDPNGDGSVDVDEDADGDGVIDPGEDVDGDGVLDTAEDVQNILREHDPMPEAMQAAVVENDPDATEEDDADYSSSDVRYISFGQNGFRRMNDGTLPVAIGLVLCDARGNVLSGGGPDLSTARALELSTTGRAAVTRSKDRITELGGCST